MEKFGDIVTHYLWWSTAVDERKRTPQERVLIEKIRESKSLSEVANMMRILEEGRPGVMFKE